MPGASASLGSSAWDLRFICKAEAGSMNLRIGESGGGESGWRRLPSLDLWVTYTVPARPMNPRGWGGRQQVLGGMTATSAHL